jgi:ribonucleoside-diphosphate reductase alpha chain
VNGSRERLDGRRGHWLYRFQSGGHHFTGGVGRFPDGRLAEVFITGTKVGSAAETNAQDAAIVASLALQHGCPVDTIRHALASRSVGGDGPLAALLNEVAKDEGGPNAAA